MPVIDASVAAAAMIVTDTFRLTARTWLGNARRSGLRNYAPTLLLAELGSAVARASGRAENGTDAIAQFRRSGLVFIPVSEALATRAGEIAATRGVKGCDAIYVALAEQLGEPLVTFDGEQLMRAAGLIAVERPG